MCFVHLYMLSRSNSSTSLPRAALKLFVMTHNAYRQNSTFSLADDSSVSIFNVRFCEMIQTKDKSINLNYGTRTSCHYQCIGVLPVRSKANTSAFVTGSTGMAYRYCTRIFQPIRYTGTSYRCIIYTGIYTVI
jgi:hypothetical protein